VKTQLPTSALPKVNKNIWKKKIEEESYNEAIKDILYLIKNN